jgi:transcriptional regulator with XRE-family HTH domain
MVGEVICKNIKLLRKTKGLTLQDLEDLTGLTKGYLSKIERSHKAPPYSTLDKLARALGVHVNVLTSEKVQKLEDPRIEFVKQGEGKIEHTGFRGKGYDYQALATRMIGKNMKPYILEPAFEEQGTFQHEGEEFLFVLEGTHELIYDGKKYIMEQGDCVYYDANVPHTGRSLGDKRSKILAIMYHYKRY